MVRSSLDSPIELIFEDNIPSGEDLELSPELINLFVTLFGEDFLEKCSHLLEGFDGSAS